MMRCDKNEIPIADLYRNIEEHIVLKGRLESVQVFSKLFTNNQFFSIKTLKLIYLMQNVGMHVEKNRV